MAQSTGLPKEYIFAFVAIAVLGLGGITLFSGKPNSKLMQLAQAIAAAEGYGIPNAIPTRANNPGDLVLGDLGNGTLGAGITVLNADTANNPSGPNGGWFRLYAQLNLILEGSSGVYTPDMSISEIASRWTATQQDAWASNVAAELGVSPDTSLNDWYNS